MNRLHKPSFWLGVCVVAFGWTANDLFAAEDARTTRFAVLLVLAVTSAVMTVWIARGLATKRPAGTLAHIDAESVYTYVRCSGCGAHLVYVEHGQDLAQLTSARDDHTCEAVKAP
ncbi:hypothetical protein HD597_011275 [Nonomuraea thailandensis]|uniref:Uncharacterized protein n=1 Tax=Nonomuraea thailandensis TaxID=1188745 RepID=A0A9X2K905_9ACTN|nr:hypothetical protein [Nonomuraea thailandensis]MCP2364255.1 hypothetical protein [Nonomuraea thailandensis]